MFSKVFLFVLIGCTLTLAFPVYRNGESLDEANFPNNEVKEAVENIIIKVSQAVKEVLEALTKQISEGLNSEALKQSVDNLIKLLKEAFNNENEQSPSEQEIHNAIKEAVKNISEVYKGILNAFFQKVEEKLNDEELNKSIEHLKNMLEKIFAYDNIKEEQRSLSAPTSEEIDDLTNGELELEKSFKGLLQDLLSQILENSSEEINSEEVKIVKNILEKLSD